MDIPQAQLNADDLFAQIGRLSFTNEQLARANMELQEQIKVLEAEVALLKKGEGEGEITGEAPKPEGLEEEVPK